MYQVTIKGRTLSELKEAVSDINDELTNGTVPVRGMEKDLAEIEVTEDVKVEVEKDIEEFAELAPSVPYTEVAVESSMDLDSEGLPWDMRIHASSKKKVANGTWRTKRNLDKDLLAQTKAELRGSLERLSNPVAIPEAPSAPVLHPALDVPVVAPVIVPMINDVDPLGIIQPAIEAVQKAITEAPAPIPVQPTVSSGHTLETFKANFPMILVELINNKKIDQDYVNALKAHFKVEELWALDDEKKAQVYDSFAEYGFITKVG